MSRQGMSPEARRAVERAWLEVLRARHPELVWTVRRESAKRQPAQPKKAAA
jgi:hypothetical protein